MEADFVTSVAIYLLVIIVAIYKDSKMKFSRENVILIFAAIVVAYLTFQVFFGDDINFEIGGSFGQTVGGILAFFSILLLYFSIRNQAKAFLVNQFEIKFYEQIKYHRQNVDSMVYRSPASKNKKDLQYVRSNRVFLLIHREINEAIWIVHTFFQENSITEFYKPGVTTRLILDGRKSTFNQIAILDIAYLVVFFGVGLESIPVLRKILKNMYLDEVVDRVIEQFRLIPTQYSRYRTRFLNKNYQYKNKAYDKYFGGHQHRLGHYYRHLFQTVNFVDEESDLGMDYKKKYQYTKKVRAQLSTYEQSVLFFNSVSQLGRGWELERSLENRHLITKYNLIKNIPKGFIASNKMDDIYPNISYESSGKPPTRERLENMYS